MQNKLYAHHTFTHLNCYRHFACAFCSFFCFFPLCFQAWDFSGFFLISGLFSNLHLPKNVLERREVATTERKK